MKQVKLMGRVIVVMMISSWFMLGGEGQQISTPCTSSMISTFTPCLNFITGSSGGSVTPTAGCCDSLKSLTSTGMECACLILTANVPLPTGFINRTLALALPRACKMGGVPLQCKAAGTPLPAPGPVPFLLPSPPPPPMSALSPGSSKVVAPALTPAPAPDDDLADGPIAPTAKPGIRPVVQPMQPKSLAQSSTATPFLPLLFILLIMSTL